MSVTEEEQFALILIQGIVKKPDDVIVVRSVDPQGVLLTIKVSRSDMGLVIGRDGANSTSIKHMLNLFGRNRRFSLNLKIEEPDKK